MSRETDLILKHNGVSHFEQGEIRSGMESLIEACHGLSYRAGWWDDPKTGKPLPFTTETFGMKIALIHSEVSEALEGYRKAMLDEHLPDRPSVEVELSDAIIRICDLAGKMGLDLPGAILDKLAYNQIRADHKLENRAKPDGKAF